VNTTSQQTHTSLAQRLATVRNCMLVELSTGVSPTDKDLFASLCQTYEQNSVVTSSSTGASSQKLLDQAFSISHLTAESSLPDGHTAMSRRDTPPTQSRVGLSIIRWLDSADFRGFDDWDKGNR